jgi:hypothetical protein
VLVPGHFSKVISQQKEILVNIFAKRTLYDLIADKLKPPMPQVQIQLILQGF